MENEGVCPRESGSKKSMESISILVVDDDTACLAAVATTLKMFKYEVVTAKHANDALSTLRIKGGGFDLVISDVHMPDMNGFELQQAIAQEFKNLPVVLMSDDPDEGVALKGLDNGAVFFICKPVCPNVVRDLWKFAAVIKPSQVTIHGEEITEKFKETVISLSSLNEDGGSKKESPRNEGSISKHPQKKAKMVWNHSLRARFLEAIRIIGLDRAVPKKIMEVMNVPGLTREHVASHLQKYRIFLKKVSNASCQVREATDHKRVRSVNLFTRPTSLTLPALTLNEFPYQKLNFSYPLMSPTTMNINSIPASMITPSDYVDLNLKRLTGTVSKPFDGNLSNPGDDPFMVENNITHAGNQLSDVVSDVVRDYGVMSPTTYNSSSIPASMTTPSDYVDLNLKRLTVIVSEPFHSNATVVDLSNPGKDPFMDGNNISHGDQLSDVVGDYGMMMQMPSNPHLHGGNVWNAGGLNREEAYNPMCHTTYPEQVNILNQAQTHGQQDECATFTTSNIFGDDTRCLDHNIFTYFDPAPNQQYMVEPQDQLLPNSYAQLINDEMLLPPPPKEQDDDEFLDSLFV